MQGSDFKSSFLKPLLPFIFNRQLSKLRYIKTMKMKNIFKNIPKQLPDELFENIISKDSLQIERIISKGHTTPESQWYDQDTDEWVVVLKGEAILSFEDSNDVTLSTGDYINIPAHTKHRVSWTIPNQETVWLAIHY